MTFGFLLFDQLEELDLLGPWEMITTWGVYADGPTACCTISQLGEGVTCAKGMRLAADYSFADGPPLDYLLIPGGPGTRVEVDNPVLIDFVRDQAKRCKIVASVCTGAFLLQAAGLLRGKRATTHWKSLDRLRQFAEVMVVEERFVRDGAVWTAAGVSAGIDMALALIADQGGAEAAGMVQLYAEYYPSGQRYGTAHQQPGLPGYLKAE